MLCASLQGCSAGSVRWEEQMPGPDQGEHVGRSLRRKHGPVRRRLQVREEEEDEEADEEGAQGVLIGTNDLYQMS